MDDSVDQVIGEWRAELPELASAEQELAKRVWRIGVLLDSASSAELDRAGLTRAEYGMLVTLRRGGPPYRLKPSELSRALLLSSGGTTNTLHRLAAAGLVERQADPDDRRSTWVALTPAGVELAGTVAAGAGSAHAALLSAVSAGTVAELNRLLREVLVALGDRPYPARTRR